jgi:hypothetical protein
MVRVGDPERRRYLGGAGGISIMGGIFIITTNSTFAPRSQ